MMRIRKLMVAMLFRYGLTIGIQPSFHGTYEATVPMKLKLEKGRR